MQSPSEDATFFLLPPTTISPFLVLSLVILLLLLLFFFKCYASLSGLFLAALYGHCDYRCGKTVVVVGYSAASGDFLKSHQTQLSGRKGEDDDDGL